MLARPHTLELSRAYTVSAGRGAKAGAFSMQAGFRQAFAVVSAVCAQLRGLGQPLVPRRLARPSKGVEQPSRLLAGECTEECFATEAIPRVVFQQDVGEVSVGVGVPLGDTERAEQTDHGVASLGNEGTTCVAIARPAASDEDRVSDLEHRIASEI